MKGLGSGIRKFMNTKNDVKEKIREGLDKEPKETKKPNSES